MTMIKASNLLNSGLPFDVTYFKWDSDVAPEPGESVRLIDTARTGDADSVQYIEIPHTAWSDQMPIGSTIDRSNSRVLLDRYADHLVTVYDSAGTETLYVRADSEIPVDLYDTIIHLHDYAVLDEHDLSNLEFELELADWDAWGRSDFVALVRDAAREAGIDDDLPELDDEAHVDALAEGARLAHDVPAYEATRADGGRFAGMCMAARYALSLIVAARAGNL